MKQVRIGNEHTGYVRVGGDNPCAVMAEVGINHDGSVERALELVRLAAGSGADLIKFQLIDPDAMVQRGRLGAVWEIYRRHTLSLEDMARVSHACAERSVPFVCTVFDQAGAARMVELGVNAFKVASCDMTHHPLLASLGQYGLPVLLSTGLADLEEVGLAVRALKHGGCKEIVLLHCVSAYPAPAESVNLRAMQTLQRRFRCPVGYSDHTEGALAPALAASLGASIVEKHFTWDSAAPGPDHALSLGPEAFRRMVGDIRLAEKMRGHGRKVPAQVERAERKVGRRGYYLLREVHAGEKVDPKDLAALKPWTEVGPQQWHSLRSLVYARDMAAGEGLNRADVKPFRPAAGN
ncbi:N-acetylneuraminate synthase family protein [bacterium]|nr:N-acetylneuraminate synthase family protein [bacterium]